MGVMEGNVAWELCILVVVLSLPVGTCLGVDGNRHCLDMSR